MSKLEEGENIGTNMQILQTKCIKKNEQTHNKKNAMVHTCEQ